MTKEQRKIIDLARKVYEKYGRNEIFLDIENLVLESKDPEWNTIFAGVPGADVRSHEQVVLDSKNPYCNTVFAKIPGADFEAHEQVVLESEDLFWNTEFAKIPGADVSAHREVVYASDDPYMKHRFDEKFPLTDEEKLESRVKDCKNDGKNRNL